MTKVKRIVCLANSVKIGGRCIAGREVLNNGHFGEWVRPVSARPTAEVTFLEYKYQNNTSPKVLDIIDVPLLEAAPHGHQTENHIINPERWWEKVDELPWNRLEQLQERPRSLWINSDSTDAGAFNCISRTEASSLNNSLVLIKKKKFGLEISSTSWQGRKKKAYRGNFKYKGIYYSLSVTDPVARNAFKEKPEGEYPMEDVYLCISLTEPWDKDNNRCHKLIAAIIGDPPL